MLSKIIAILPVSFPAKIYHAASLVPIFKQILNKIITSKIPPQITIPEGVLILDQTDPVVSGALALGAFEKTGIDLFRKCLKSDSIVIDIGANIGYYTVIAGKYTRKVGRIFSYEPENGNFNILNKNIKINNLKNVTPLKMGISNLRGASKLYLDNDNKGHHSLLCEEGKSFSTIETDTLDNSLKMFGSPKIDIIKMDIEGAEFLALEGMTATIRNSPNLILFTEFFPKAIIRFGGNPREYLKKLLDFGFSLLIIDEATKQIIPIDNIDYFMKTFPKGEAFKNIFAVKGNSKNLKS